MAKNLTEFANPEFIKTLKLYKQIRDCFDGSDAIKEARETYLPALKNQSSEDYLNYLSRALFFPITGKTCSTLVGLAISSKPKVEYPAELDSYFVDQSADRQFLEQLFQIMTEVILMGRFGMLIDADSAGSAKLVPYIAENIVRWITNDLGRPIDVMLREFVYEPIANQEFSQKQVCRYRRCQLIQNTYVVTVLNEDLQPTAPAIVPTFAGSSIDHIPLTVFGATGTHLWIDKSPMLDISTINLSHYLSSADLEWGRHLTGLPTPVVTGVDQNSPLYIGGTKAWILPPPEARAFFLEFQGQGLGSLEKAMSEKIGLMASMSARMIDVSTRGSEAAETVRLRYSSDSASLIHIIGSVESGLNLMYNDLRSILKIPGRVSIALSKDVLGSPMSFSDLTTLFENYFKGGLSKESLVYNLRRVGALDPNRSDEDEMGAIRNPEDQLLPKQVGTGE